MRHDGEVTVYQIEHKDNKDNWVGSNFDYFGTPEGFSASCACWQETGITGTYNKDTAICAVMWLANKYAGTTFRAVERKYTQSTREVCMARISGPVEDGACNCGQVHCPECHG